MLGSYRSADGTGSKNSQQKAVENRQVLSLDLKVELHSTLSMTFDQLSFLLAITLCSMRHYQRDLQK